MRVTIVIAQPAGADIRTVDLEDGARVADALAAAGLSALADDPAARLGVHARRVAPDSPLADGDRLEVYRPLYADPQDTRRRRAHGKRG